MLKRLLFAAAVALAPTWALAQQSVLQGGSQTSGHIPTYANTGGSTAVVKDGGDAGGGAAGTNPAEIGITARGTGTPPYQGQGHGPNGEIFCTYDAPITNSTGYHYLCLSPNVGSAGIISYGAGGGASTQSLNFLINGTTVTPGGLVSASSGYIIGNNTASTAVVAAVTITSMLDRAFGSTVGSVLYRNSTEWAIMPAGTTAVRQIATGTVSDTAADTDGTIAWDSATSGSKAQAIPGCSSANPGRILRIKDQQGNSGSGGEEITVTPAAGTIDGGSYYTINSNGAAITIQCDGISDWMVM